MIYRIESAIHIHRRLCSTHCSRSDNLFWWDLSELFQLVCFIFGKQKPKVFEIFRTKNQVGKYQFCGSCTNEMLGRRLFRQRKWEEPEEEGGRGRVRNQKTFTQNMLDYYTQRNGVHSPSNISHACCYLARNYVDYTTMGYVLINGISFPDQIPNGFPIDRREMILRRMDRGLKLSLNSPQFASPAYRNEDFQFHSRKSDVDLRKKFKMYIFDPLKSFIVHRR